MKTNYDIQAFPRPGFTAEQTESQEGMTLRDWFAGQALTGMIPAMRGIYKDNPQASVNAVDQLVKESFSIADAMLKQRTLE